MLEVNKISVSYETAQVLWDISFKVNEGDIVTIIGSNGAGKSTLLKTISGLLHPTSGTIEFLGERIDNLPPHRIVERGISLVPEGRRLFPKLTVFENLKVASYTRYARKRMKENLNRVFGLYPILKKRAKQLAGTLSGGERQMLAIGRGLMANPKLLMLDELSLGLAPKLVIQIFETIKALIEEEVTILLVEQHIHHALSLANRGYVIETGRITLHGASKELLENELVKKSYLGL